MTRVKAVFDGRQVNEMHMVIYALVDASTEDDALAAGQTVFDRLVEASTVAGPARWGNLPVAAPIDSDAGQQLLERGWDATEEEFQRNLNRVREALKEYSDEAIMPDEDLVRHAFHQVGAYDGPSIFIYDQHGNGVPHRGQLDRLVEETDDCWIVPADVHY